MKVFFFHGLESGPHGSKYQTISKTYEVNSPDFQGLDLEARLAKAEAETAGLEDIIVVGSSFGGLVAALLYDRHPERFRTYILLAPAIYDERSSGISRAPKDGVVIHGTHDDIVPIEPVQAFAAKHHLRFIEVDDEHRLAASHDVIMEALAQANAG